jgi:glycosyltransferase involved in cell wall biosynthesis
MGLSELIHAIRIIKDISKINIELTIGGQGNEYINLKKLVMKLKCDKQIKLVGYIPEEEIRNVIIASDLFILPSRKLEGFGLVILESMACGTPVLVSPYGGQKEIIEKYDNTLILDDIRPGTIALKILDIIEGRKLTSKFRNDTINFVNSNFSWKKHATDYEKIYAKYV